MAAAFFFLLVHYKASRDWCGDICSILPEAALHLCSVPRPVAVTHATPRLQGKSGRRIQPPCKSTCRQATVLSTVDRRDESPSLLSSLPAFCFSSVLFFSPWFCVFAGGQLARLDGICFPGFPVDFVDLLRRWPCSLSLSLSAGSLRDAAYANPSVVLHPNYCVSLLFFPRDSSAASPFMWCTIIPRQ